MGGFNVDKHLQVLGWNDQPVGGLYAAGETVGGIHGAHYLGGATPVALLIRPDM